MKKLQLKTYNDFFKSIWNTFTALSTFCGRIDIVFDLYLKHSIKASERRRRVSVEEIETLISSFDQALPVEFDRFWPLSKTKLQYQKFSAWIIENLDGENFEKQLFLGGSQKEDKNACLSFSNGLAKVERLLQCSHEEADDRLFYHANHALKVGNYRSILIATSDADIFASATQNFKKLSCHDLAELWYVSGGGNSRTFFPIHDLANSLNPNLMDVLVPAQSVSGADALSKVSTKAAVVREAQVNHELLTGFGQDPLTEEMIKNAETFLLRCISKHKVDSFDELRYIVYHEKHLHFDLERFPPTSDSIRQHILRYTRHL